VVVGKVASVHCTNTPTISDPGVEACQHHNELRSKSSINTAKTAMLTKDYAHASEQQKVHGTFYLGLP